MSAVAVLCIFGQSDGEIGHDIFIIRSYSIADLVKKSRPMTFFVISLKIFPDAVISPVSSAAYESASLLANSRSLHHRTLARRIRPRFGAYKGDAPDHGDKEPRRQQTREKTYEADRISQGRGQKLSTTCVTMAPLRSSQGRLR